jgi:hypothetical protein
VPPSRTRKMSDRELSDSSCIVSGGPESCRPNTHNSRAEETTRRSLKRRNPHPHCVARRRRACKRRTAPVTIGSSKDCSFLQSGLA